VVFKKLLMLSIIIKRPSINNGLFNLQYYL
jgi:hypothetical protein